MGEYDDRGGAALQLGRGVLRINGSGPVINGMNGANRMSTHAAGDGHSMSLLEAERARLEQEIAAAEARKAAAERRATDGTGDMHAVVMHSKEQLAEIERLHGATIEAIRAQARDEVERIIADAHRQVGTTIDPSAGRPAEGTRPGFA